MLVLYHVREPVSFSYVFASCYDIGPVSFSVPLWVLYQVKEPVRVSTVFITHWKFRNPDF